MSWFGRSTDPEKQAIQDQSETLDYLKMKRREAMARLIAILDDASEDVSDETPPSEDAPYKNGKHGD